MQKIFIDTTYTNEVLSIYTLLAFKQHIRAFDENNKNHTILFKNIEI